MIFRKPVITEINIEEQFMEQFYKVFTEGNIIKACGRDACKKLIELAREIDSSRDYGDTETGFMNPDNLIKLHERLLNK